ncbi:MULTISPECIES: hypothetical protein [unclassified Streptomyces]|uniref:hypothetical protein n=1 Tax=unclassified Streptomyces TaxID=2593676 RepID=UPI000A48BA73|nr:MULTISPECIES: hypothetical protein [unclassified Streptomyces]
MNTTTVRPGAGTLLRALRPGSRAIVRVTGVGVDGLVVVDATTLTRPRTVPLAVVRPYEVLYRSRPPRSGYVLVPESDFVHQLMDDALCKALGRDDPYAVVHVRAHPDWAAGGIARLTYDYEEIGPACEKALARAGFGAEPAPWHGSGYGSALCFRRQDRHHLCPMLEKPPRDLEGWEPWSCDRDRGHTEPYHNTEIDDTGPDICGAYVLHGTGRSPGGCVLSAGHPPAQDHRDISDAYRPGRIPQGARSQT